MEKHIGKKVCDGLAIGSIRVLRKQKYVIKRKTVDNVKNEILRYENAKEKTLLQLEGLYKEALERAGKEGADIFEIHSMILKDVEYNDQVIAYLKKERVNAEYAVMHTGEVLSSSFENMEDDYFNARAVDVIDISDRVVANLLGKENSDINNDNNVIIIANELTPSDVLKIDRTRIKGFVTKRGSNNSHTAILARQMGIPSLIGIDIREEWEGKISVIDTKEGALILDPSKEELEKYKALGQELMEEKNALKQYIGMETKTSNGQKIRLYANIGHPDDIEAVIKNDGEGIGLFRSEYLFLQRDTFPTEDEQLEAYKKVGQLLEGKEVIIRTLDIGADKRCSYLNIEDENNPALGYRAIRICLDNPELLKTQLKAILRAGAYGNIAVMYPMITSLEEIKQIKKIYEAAKEELREQKLEFKDIRQGIMIETPAAVMISDILAREVDFFSIGTNDLTQYTLAIDRTNDKLHKYYDPHHEAVLRMIELTIKNAHSNNISVGICGELGSDETLIPRLLKMGVDELSVAPGRILGLRKIIAGL